LPPDLHGILPLRPFLFFVKRVFCRLLPGDALFLFLTPFLSNTWLTKMHLRWSGRHAHDGLPDCGFPPRVFFLPPFFSHKAIPESFPVFLSLSIIRMVIQPLFEVAFQEGRLCTISMNYLPLPIPESFPSRLFPATGPQTSYCPLRLLSQPIFLGCPHISVYLRRPKSPLFPSLVPAKALSNPVKCNQETPQPSNHGLVIPFCMIDGGFLVGV